MAAIDDEKKIESIAICNDGRKQIAEMIRINGLCALASQERHEFVKSVYLWFYATLFN